MKRFTEQKGRERERCTKGGERGGKKERWWEGKKMKGQKQISLASVWQRMWEMNCLIGTFVSIRMWSSVSALTEGFPGGGPTSGLPPCDFNTRTAPEGHLLQPCTAARSSHLLKYTHTHTSYSDGICCWLDAEKCGSWGAIRGQKSNVTGDTAAIIETYEESADQDLAGWHVFPCACVPHRPNGSWV